VPLLFLSGELREEEVRCTAKVVDGHSATAGAHRRHVTTSSSWSTSLFPHVVVELLFWWSRKQWHPVAAAADSTCCTGDDENIRSQQQTWAICFHSSQSQTREEHPN
jgi:hypothetical protein